MKTYSKLAIMATLVTGQMAFLPPMIAPVSAQVIDEIQVIARKRSESLQDVPAAVTAFTSTTIEDAGIERPSDFINLTSNITLIEVQNAGNAFVVLRGISQNRNSEPSVAVVVDGVQQVNPAQFNQELFDIEQIEVLKGPQGSLYGRNAIGGAIVIQTKKPSDEFEGKIKIGSDSGDGFRSQLSMSGPVNDKIAYRLSASLVDIDGYLDNTYLNEKADPYKDLSIRGRLLFEPNDNLSIDLRASMSRLETQGFYYNIVPNLAGFNWTGPGDGDANDTSLPIQVNNPGMNERDMTSFSMKIDYEMDAGTLTATSSFDQLEEINTGDAWNFLPRAIAGIPVFFCGGNPNCDQNQSQFLDVESWSQEIRFAAEPSDKISWIAGVYAIGTERFISTGNMSDLGNGVFPVYRTPSTNALNPQVTFLADSQDNFAWAVFADLTYQMTDATELNVSLRYDEDEREQTTETPQNFLVDAGGNAIAGAQTGQVRKETFDELQPKITLRHDLNDDVTIYGGYSTGFRSGGFNQTGVGILAARPGVKDIFEAETATTIELGFKSKLMDNRLSLNGAVFMTETENSYFFYYDATTSTQNLGNIDEGELQGFELDGVFMVTDNLQLNFGYGYTDSEITDFATTSSIGNKMPGVSESTTNLGLQYVTDIPNDGELMMRVDYQNIGDTYWDTINTKRDPVDLIDARISMTFGDMTLSIWGRNLGDEEYNAEYSPGGFVYKAKPRRWGIEAVKRF
ncbi:MAG: TonB-dependent receptor [Parvibaculales bacterium]